MQLKEVTAGLSLWCFKSRRGTIYLIFVPKKLQMPPVEWYHETLKHIGKTRTKETIGQHYEVVRKYICQINKITGQRNYGHLPLVTTKRDNPWSDVHIDMVGPWTIIGTNEEMRRYKRLPIVTPVSNGWK